MMRFLSGLLLALAAFGLHAQETDLLEAEQAFKFSARMLDANLIEVRYQIAKGYYLYRDKLKFDAQPAAVKLGPPRLPPGKVKQDEFFGRVESYRDEIVIKLPVSYSQPGPQSFTLKAVSQGCADAGVCYPPLEQKIELKPVQAAVAAPPALAALKSLGGEANSAADFLPPELAFAVELAVKDPTTVVAEFKPAAGYYLYRNKIAFALKSPAGMAIDKVTLPAGEAKDDPTFGKTEVYHQPFQAVITLKRSGEGKQRLSLQASFQGCSEKGVCYPPQQKTFDLTLPTVSSAQAAPLAAAPTPPQSRASDSEDSQITALLKGGSFWVVVASFFGFGLLLALTPCVFPMIPILSGIIAGQGEHLTKRRGFALSLSYVLGMALTYAAAGVAAGLTGSMISSALQNPWVLSLFALVFVALALSMFGFYSLQMPAFVQTRFSEASNRMHGGKMTGVFVMGSLSAVIVGPCVAAPLAGALAYIGLTRDVWLGGWALFAMALGMGAPLLLIGVSAGALLPRAGAWMEAVKAFFGVLLLAVAIWLISPVIPAVVHMLLWAVLLIISAMYLRAIDPLPHTADGFSRFWKGVGILLLIGGVALLVGALSGSRDLLQPLAGLRGAAAAEAGAPAGHLRFERVKSLAELEQRVRKAGGKYVMLDFYADWCVSCKEMERFTFSDAKVQGRLKDAVLLQADVTANSEDDKALLKRFGLFGPPGIIFFDRSGSEIRTLRVIGYQAPEKFLASLNTAIPE